jgi:ABC-2 type transport system permease protein
MLSPSVITTRVLPLVLTTPIQADELAKGAISAVVYATLFWGFAFYRFTRKGVTS